MWMFSLACVCVSVCVCVCERERERERERNVGFRISSGQSNVKAIDTYIEDFLLYCTFSFLLACRLPICTLPTHVRETNYLHWHALSLHEHILCMTRVSTAFMSARTCARLALFLRNKKNSFILLQRQRERGGGVPQRKSINTSNDLSRMPAHA